MNRLDYLELATSIICHDRPTIHGDAAQCFNLIADYWTTFLRRRHGSHIIISDSDVAVLMSLFKIARWQINGNHADNIVDGLGYLALAGELQDADKWTPLNT